MLKVPKYMVRCTFGHSLFGNPQAGNVEISKLDNLAKSLTKIMRQLVSLTLALLFNLVVSERYKLTNESAHFTAAK